MNKELLFILKCIRRNTTKDLTKTCAKIYGGTIATRCMDIAGCKCCPLSVRAGEYSDAILSLEVNLEPRIIGDI